MAGQSGAAHAGSFDHGKMFLMRISSTSGLGSAIIVVDYVLEIWIEPINRRNDNFDEKFYLMQIIFKSRKMTKISEKIKHFKK